MNQLFSFRLKNAEIWRKNQSISEFIFKPLDLFQGIGVTKVSRENIDKEFFENLSQDQFAKIRKFFDTMPKLRHETKVKNPKTGVESKITFSGLQDFFGLASPTIA